MKLLQDNKKLHAEEFSNASPYVIMFGPDKCGATNKVRESRVGITPKLIREYRCTLFSNIRIPKLANMKKSI